MTKKLTEAAITTANARKELPPGEYARRLDPDAALWYRKGRRGGTWFARWRNYGAGAAYRQKSIGAANDKNDKPTAGLLVFDQAERLAREVVADARAALKAAEAGPVLTVRDAIEAYSASRDARDSARAGRPVRSDARTRLARYVVGEEARGKRQAVEASALADVALYALTERDLLQWRAKLPSSLRATTRQRLINDLKAALNTAQVENRSTLPGDLSGTIKHGLRAIVGDDEQEPVARDNQILTDVQVAKLVAAAREVDDEQGWDGDLFRLVVVLAATGARFSQITRMRVSDVQGEHQRLLVPVSRKGRRVRTGTVTVPIGADVIDALAPAIADRSSTAILLERWRRKQIGMSKWTKDRRGPWQASAEIVRPWDSIALKAGLAGLIPYALRHSSIVRQIRANLPLRLVAAAHDTSTAMIERHYAKWITSGLEELTRTAVVPIVSTENPPSESITKT